VDEQEKENYDKLWAYLGTDIDIDRLISIFYEVGVLYDSSQAALAEFLLGWANPNDVWKILSRDLIPDLASEHEAVRQEALEKMREMGFPQKVDQE